MFGLAPPTDLPPTSLIPAKRLLIPPFSTDKELVEILRQGTFLPLYRVVYDPSSTLPVTQTTDVSTGVYEGGFKLWECTFDLCSYISAGVQLESKRVVDLGCGQGLAGIMALHLGASSVTFQDLNEDVLLHMTSHNVVANGFDLEKSDFIAGDWADPAMKRLLPPQSADVVLSSETLYNTRCIPTLYDLIYHILTDTGIAYIASKKFYFGVGGGTLDWIAHMESKSDLVLLDTVEFNDGSSNLREILIVKKSVGAEETSF